MQFSVSLVALIAVLATGTAATSGQCTDGLIYCGRSLRGMGQSLLPIYVSDFVFSPTRHVLENDLTNNKVRPVDDIFSFRLVLRHHPQPSFSTRQQARTTEILTGPSSSAKIRASSLKTHSKSTEPAPCPAGTMERVTTMAARGEAAEAKAEIRVLVRTSDILKNISRALLTYRSRSCRETLLRLSGRVRGYNTCSERW